jgi:hypothetical protein
MNDSLLTFTAVFHVVYARLHEQIRVHDNEGSRSDRGAVSIEHVLWYAAAAISVAVVAAIIWSQVRTTASTPVQSPSAP